jgi:60 kDa SS-A/Ro ribonucleoprotein
MVRLKSLFGFDKQKPYRDAAKLNKEGFPAFDRSIEEDTLAVLTTNTLSNTFYVDARSLAKETVAVLDKMGDEDPAFLARALVYARNKGLMRLAPIVGLAVLSVKDRGRKDNFRRAFDLVIRTPDDLREFVALCRTGTIRKGLGGEARDAVKRRLQRLSPYHAVKYGSARSEGMTLRDILRMAHPKPVNRAQEELFGWLVKGWTSIGPEPSPTNPQVWAFERLKRTADEAEIVRLVRDHRLTWEVVVPAVRKMTPAVWRALLDDMPYMALLRNLATMDRHGVFQDRDTVREIAKRIADPANVRRSKQFPFRFFNAFHAFKGDQSVKDALADALERSFENVPRLRGRVCVANDISGSMGGRAAARGAARYCDIAGLLAAALFRKCDDVALLPFDTEVHAVSVSRRSAVMDIAGKIGLAQGGTDLGAPIRRLLKRKEKVDIFIGITDGEDWAGRGFLSEWEAYKAKVNRDAKAFLIAISPYRDWNAPAGHPDIHFVLGWSDAVLRYIPLVLGGGAGQVAEVRNLDFAAFEKAPAAAEEAGEEV